MLITGARIKLMKQFEEIYDYGNLSKLTKFKGTHPEVMKEWINNFNWKHQLRYSGHRAQNKMVSKHDKYKYRVISFIEKYLLFGGRLLGKRLFIIISEFFNFPYSFQSFRIFYLYPLLTKRA